MQAPLVMRCDFQAPWGASEATAKALSSTVRSSDGSEYLLGNFLSLLVASPLFKTSLPFGVAACGWCQDPANLGSTLWPLLRACVGVTSADGEIVQQWGWANRLPGSLPGGFGVIYGLPLKDVPEDVGVRDWERVTEAVKPKSFAPIFQQLYANLIQYSIQVEPAGIVLVAAGRTAGLADTKLVEVKRCAHQALGLD